MARALTARLEVSELVAAQLPPESVDSNSPPSKVPAKSVAGFVGSIARTLMNEFVSPALTADQLPPESVDLNTPPP
jgi:hypothetical protein